MVDLGDFWGSLRTSPNVMTQATTNYSDTQQRTCRWTAAPQCGWLQLFMWASKRRWLLAQSTDRRIHPTLIPKQGPLATGTKEPDFSPRGGCSLLKAGANLVCRGVKKV